MFVHTMPHPSVLSAHSSMSLQVTPSSTSTVKPVLQAHVKDPGVFVQAPLALSQSSVPDEHSVAAQVQPRWRSQGACMVVCSVSRVVMPAARVVACATVRAKVKQAEAQVAAGTLAPTLAVEEIAGVLGV